jgi:tetratricopeptide (TPR) repeat protein
MKLRFLIFFLLLSFNFRAQHGKLDSLKQLLNSMSVNDTAKVGVLNVLAYETYMKKENSEGEVSVLIDSAIRSAERLNYIRGNIKARFIAGNIYKNSGQFNKARQHLFKALELCGHSKRPEDHFKINHTLSQCYTEQGDYKKAVEYCFTALGFAEQTGDKTLIANSYGALGNIYASQGDHNNAIQYHLKSLKLRTELNDRMRMSFSYVNLADNYKSIKKYDSAHYYFNKALVIQTAEKNTVGQGFSYAGIGNIYLKKGLPSAAIGYFNRAMALVANTDDAEIISNLYNSSGETYLLLKDYKKAEENLLKGIEFNLKTHKLPELKESYLLLSKTYNAKRDFERAYQYHLKFTEVKDSLSGTEIGKKISSFEYNYRIEQDKKIAALENEKIKMKHEEEVKKQRLIIWSVSLIVVVISLFSLFIFKQYKAKKEANLIITRQKSEIERQHSELAEKNKEILDSIRYAKRIQKALMPSEKYIERKLGTTKKEE